MSPTSPRQINIDPHLPVPSRSHAVNLSPNALSPSRAIGPHHVPHPGHPHRGNSNHGRSYRDEEGARERQMQQDIESAMSMSRARSGSINNNNDTSPGMRPSQMHYPSTSPIDEASFPMLSDLEEAEMERARSARFRVQDDDVSDEDGHHGYQEHRRRRRSSHHSEERGEGMMDHRDIRERESGSSGFDSNSRLLQDRERSDRDRVRLAEREMTRSNFDFIAMEEYAEKERESTMGGESGPKWIPSEGDEQGLKRRNNRSAGPSGLSESYGTTMDRTNTMSQYGDDLPERHSGEIRSSDRDDGRDLEGDHIDGDNNFSPKESVISTTNFHRRRQRKLSQSNPVQRRQGKLALFEGLGSLGGGNDTGSEALSGFKAPRQPKNLGPAASQPFVPFTDAAPGHDRPYRFSFYSNALPVTIHSRSLAELPAEGQTFEDLFKGKNTDNTVKNDLNGIDIAGGKAFSGASTPVESGIAQSQSAKMSLLARAASAAGAQNAAKALAKDGAGEPSGGLPGNADDDPEAYTWWLDVLSPTDEEMRMLSKVFGIHPLTTEDILLEETREKIELFRNYYLVCFRSFDQDPYSQTYLEPLNMYIIVFREGTLSFHFRGTPHPQNVRRRIKHLKDYISVTSDWISYALIDDITDAFGPLIQSIEYEVDSIDELVLILKEAEQSDMLRRIGTCRKKVMGLLRLMGNKADVVKGLAKRSNEQWLVAPKSDIGLYLSDIQDHLITMTQNLNHYEKILSRSHSNYLAQISIEMTDANNQINDVLSKLTALGTVLIPMNLVTGLWGMNVHVPGEDVREGYAWFGGIVGCLGLFALVGAFATWKCFVR